MKSELAKQIETVWELTDIQIDLCSASTSLAEAINRCSRGLDNLAFESLNRTKSVLEDVLRRIQKIEEISER